MFVFHVPRKRPAVINPYGDQCDWLTRRSVGCRALK